MRQSHALRIPPWLALVTSFQYRACAAFRFVRGLIMPIPNGDIFKNHDSVTNQG
jgi:hypothetical protein